MRYTLRGQKNSAASQPQLSFKAVNNKASQYLSSTSLARGAQPVVKALTRHLRLPIMTLSALGAAMMVSPAAAQSSLPTFDCVNEAYNVFGAPSQLQRFDPASRTVLSSIPINPGLGVNAIGFNPQDNYLYGRINNTNGIAGFTAGEFIRIGEDGSVESLGVPSPATPGEAPFTANNASGTMDAAGNWYGISGSDVFIVNIGNNPAAGSLTYTSVARSASTIIPFDLAFSAFDGAIYGMSGGLVRIDPVTGFGSIVTTTGDPLAGSGGAWSTADGTLFFYSNSSGTLRSVDVSQPTPVVTIVGSVPSNSSFDSAACLPPSLAKGILGAPDADGRFSYEFTISNAFPNSISVNFNDVLPPELDFVPGSLSPAAPGGATVTTFDNDTLRLSNMSLGALSNLTFSAQVELVPGVAAGTPVSNQATLEFGATTLNSTDPDGGGSGAPTTFAVAAAPSLILDKPAPVNADAGQFEINFNHVPDALAAADYAVLFKRLVREAARKHGYGATFMAKPYGDPPGSGMHVHVSLLDKDGMNIFSADDGLAAPLTHAIGGLLGTMQEMQAIFAPHANSYRRFQPGSYAPVALNWGMDHRGVAIRVPAPEGKGARLEHRICGADVNPYLALTAILGGIAHGLENKAEAGAPLTHGDGSEGARLHHDWTAALDAFEHSEAAKAIFGAEYVRVYTACRRHENACLSTMITDAEYKTYLHKL